MKHQTLSNFIHYQLNAFALVSEKTYKDSFKGLLSGLISAEQQIAAGHKVKITNHINPEDITALLLLRDLLIPLTSCTRTLFNAINNHHASPNWPKLVKPFIKTSYKAQVQKQIVETMLNFGTKKETIASLFEIIEGSNDEIKKLYNLILIRLVDEQAFKKLEPEFYETAAKLNNPDSPEPEHTENAKSATLATQLARSILKQLSEDVTNATCDLLGSITSDHHTTEADIIKTLDLLCDITIRIEEIEGILERVSQIHQSSPIDQSWLKIPTILYKNGHPAGQKLRDHLDDWLFSSNQTITELENLTNNDDLHIRNQTILDIDAYQSAYARIKAHSNEFYSLIENPHKYERWIREWNDKIASKNAANELLELLQYIDETSIGSALEIITGAWEDPEWLNRILTHQKHEGDPSGALTQELVYSGWLGERDNPPKEYLDILKAHEGSYLADSILAILNEEMEDSE